MVTAKHSFFPDCDPATWKCSKCKGDHWTMQCIFRDENNRKLWTGIRNIIGDKAKTDDATVIRITSLSEDTDETAVKDLLKPFGPVAKLLVPREKTTGVCKGYAYAQFQKHADAAKAIKALTGYTFNDLILDAGWAKLKEQ